MRACAFLTLSDPGDRVIDDERAHAPLRDLGWRVDTLPWSQPGVAWERYELVVIRSPWDYHHSPGRFLAVLEQIDRSGARLENSLALVRWNLEKTYLRDLAARGVETAPTVFRDRPVPGDLQRLFVELATEEIVIKPVVSANAEGAHRVSPALLVSVADELERFFSDRAFMAQPLVRAVLDEGEYSLFYFDGELSHAVLKTPGSGDFRVQEEHGGTIRAVTPDELLRRTGARVLAALAETPLYARTDFVRSNQGDSYWLMELELIEPSLYLRMDPAAPVRFARAIHARMGRKPGEKPPPASASR